MKYLLDPDLDPCPDVLNFDTAEGSVRGSRDIYTLKSTRSEKRLYSELDSRLESRHENALRISASCPSDNDDILVRSLNLGLSSPFGPLSVPANRRLFKYLVSTLQNSHPDYSFSNFIEPDDFVQEPHYRFAMDRLNRELASLSWSTTSPTTPGEPISERLDTFWEETNNMMSLASCNVFSWSPKPETNYDRDEENIWSLHYFFYNRFQKRICYIYLCSKSAVGDMPIRAGAAANRTHFRPFQYANPVLVGGGGTSAISAPGFRAHRSSSSSSGPSWDRQYSRPDLSRRRQPPHHRGSSFGNFSIGSFADYSDAADAGPPGRFDASALVLDEEDDGPDDVEFIADELHRRMPGRLADRFGYAAVREGDDEDDDDFVIRGPGDDEVDDLEGSPAYMLLPRMSRPRHDYINDMDMEL